MSAWDHPSKDLFRAGRSAMAPTSADRERVRARLAAKLGAAAVGVAITTTSASAGGATATATAAAATSAKSSLAVLVAKIAVPLLLIGGAATVAVPRIVQKNDAASIAATSKATNVPATALAGPNPAPSPAPVETATVSVSDLPPAPVARAAKPTAADPAEEARAVAAIDDALRAGDATRALALADEHAKRFPNGVLTEEREGARAIARCMNGSHSSADGFLAAHPRSPLRARISAACGTKDSP